MPKLLANNASSTLKTAITAAQTTLQIPASDVAKFPTFSIGPSTLTLTLVRRNTGEKEIVVATSHDGAGNFTVVRATEATTALTFNANDIVSARLTKGVLEAIAAGIAYNVATVLDFGAVADGFTNNLTAFNAALAACDDLFIPPGSYFLGGEWVVPDGAVRNIRGAGPNLSKLLFSASATNGIRVSHTNLTAGGSIRDLTIAGTATINSLGEGSTGVGINLSKVNGQFLVDNVEVRNFSTAQKLTDCWYVQTSNFTYLYNKVASIQVGPHTSNTGGNYFSIGKVSNTGFTGDNSASAGILMRESAGDYFEMIDATSFKNDIVLKPDAGKFVQYSFFDSVLADTPDTDGWLLDATNAGAGIVSVVCTGCWASFATNGNGVHMKGNIDGFTWNGGRSRENGQHGFYIEGGINWTINATMVARNSKLTTLTYSGINVASGVSSGAIMGCRIGNFDSGLSHSQLNGITLAGATTNVRIIGNDLSNPGSGGSGLSNGASGTIVIKGNLPAQLGYDQTSGSWMNGVATGAIAAGSTNYLGPNGQNASENLALFVAPRACVVTGFTVATDAAPGVGKNFTYTLRKNNADTAMVATQSGNAAFTAEGSGAITLAKFDSISIKLVIDAAAGTPIPRYSIKLDN